jgi:predicted enzyme related to lactoylglutathione lyase
MCEEDRNRVGAICWTDLTVDNADEIKEFYKEVIGWTVSPVDMGGYSDFSMGAPDIGAPVAGICHARGTNADLPRQWLVYITVENLGRSVERCTGMGGKILVSPREMGPHGRYCVIQDPAGAVAALIQPPPQT